MAAIYKLVLILFISLFTCFSYAAEAPQGNFDPDVVSAPLFPSASPLSSKFVAAIYNGKAEFLRHGYTTNDLNKFFLAVQRRDNAWNAANQILRGISNGSINDTNIKNYLADEMKQASANPNALAMMIKQIRELGDQTTLSTEPKKQSPDYMVILNKKGHSKVYMIVFKGIPTKNRLIKMNLTADYPYQKWLLAGIEVSKLQ